VLVSMAIALTGVALVWGFAYVLHLRRQERVMPSTAYRGIGISIGVLPAPASHERAEVSLDAAGNEIRERLSRIDPLERTVLEDLLAMLAAAGIEQAGPTLERIERALALPEPPGFFDFTPLVDQESDLAPNRFA
uniref:hypothetical protein n=1 Tax=Metallibacterium scheffleri TaxID=993689 RepID=UPI0023F1C04D